MMRAPPMAPPLPRPPPPPPMMVPPPLQGQTQGASQPVQHISVPPQVNAPARHAPLIIVRVQTLSRFKG